VRAIWSARAGALSNTLTPTINNATRKRLLMIAPLLSTNRLADDRGAAVLRAKRMGSGTAGRELRLFDN
jgi:hypothetical protein